MGLGGYCRDPFLPSILLSGKEWDGICGFGWDTIAQMGRPLYSNLQRMGSKA